MLWKILPIFKPLENMIESLVDSCRDTVQPIKGSVVYCDLIFGYAEHSGVYIGNNEIIHLNGKGVVEIVSPSGFIEGTTAIHIYVSCRNAYAVGSGHVADNARAMLGDKRNYNAILANCHQFTSGCLNGSFEEDVNTFLWMLKHETKQALGANTWRYWDVELF